MKRIAIIATISWLAYACVSTNVATAPPAKGASEASHGVASWYGQEFAGRTTANGEIFDPLLLTAAHRTLPFGTVLDVKNPKNGQMVRVRINDRGPFVGNRLIDLSYAAAQQIGLIEPGSGEVDLAIVKLGNGDREPPAPYVVSIKESHEKNAPSIEFPLPAANGGGSLPVAPEVPAAPVQSAAATPASEPSPVVVDNIQVIEEHRTSGTTVETRRQVGADGRTIENVPVNGGAPVPAPAPSSRDTASAPGHEASAALARAQHRGTPAPAPAPAPPTPAPARTRSGPTGNFVVQVGAFSVESNATALQRRLTQLGQQSYVDRANLYRVRIGPFATRELAIKARERLEAAGLSAIIIAE